MGRLADPVTAIARAASSRAIQPDTAALLELDDSRTGLHCTDALDDAQLRMNARTQKNVSTAKISPPTR